MLLNDLIKVWNKILLIKPCRGQISGSSGFLISMYGRKSMVIGEKNTDF
jgi:hypothetical protein